MSMTSAVDISSQAVLPVSMGICSPPSGIRPRAWVGTLAGYAAAGRCTAEPYERSPAGMSAAGR